MYKTSTKHVFLYFQCIGNFVLITIQMNHNYILYIFIHSNTLYKVQHCLWYCFIQFITSFPIKVYEYFILIMDSHRSGTQNELFIYFCKLVTFYLNRREKLRNRTNHGIVVFWCYIGIYILLSIYIRRSC